MVQWLRDRAAEEVLDSLMLLRAAAAGVPGLADGTLTGILTGFRPDSEDGLPLIGRDSRTGVVLATGHHTHGVTMSWLTGQIIARLLVGKDPGYPIEPFSPDRFRAD